MNLAHANTEQVRTSYCNAIHPGVAEGSKRSCFRDIPATHVCRDEIQEGPKLKCYQIGGAETTLNIVAIRRDNHLQDFNMVKIQSRPQTNGLK